MPSPTPTWGGLRFNIAQVEHHIILAKQDLHLRSETGINALGQLSVYLIAT